MHRFYDISIDTPVQTRNEIVLVGIGDSINRGTGEARGPAPLLGTVKEYTGSAMVDVTNNDVSIAQIGSIFPRLGINLNADTGKTIYFSCNGSGGSEFYPNGDNNNWSATGSLRAATISKTSGLLTYLERDSIDGVVLILGVNDARSANTLTNIKAGMDSLITWINSTYDTPPIYIAQIGRVESGTTTKVLDVRALIYNTNSTRVYADGIEHGLGLCQRYSNVKMAFDEMPAFTSMGYMRADNLHPNQAGNNYMGAGFATFIRTDLAL